MRPLVASESAGRRPGRCSGRLGHCVALMGRVVDWWSLVIGHRLVRMKSCDVWHTGAGSRGPFPVVSGAFEILGASLREAVSMSRSSTSDD